MTKDPNHKPFRVKAPFSYVILTLLVSIIGTNLTAQVNISGRLLERGTGTPIPFANIGIENTAIGSLSNADGSFNIDIPEAYTNRNLLFASLGYHRQSFQISYLAAQKKLLVELDAKIFELDPITLIQEKDSKPKSVILGNGKSLLRSGKLSYDDAYAGSAMAVRIDCNSYPDLQYIQGVSLYIAGNKSPDFKVRLRFMAVDSANGGIPGADLIEDQILAYSTIKRGWLEFDLPEAFSIEESSFYLVFEWILEKKDRQFIVNAYTTYIRENPDRVSYDTTIIDGKEVVDFQIGQMVAGTVFGTTNSKSDREQYPTYSRTNSFGAWERSASSLSAKVKLGNRPFTR